MTPQNSTNSVVSHLHGAHTSRAIINPRTGRWVHVMECDSRWTQEELDDLREIREGIVGIANIRVSLNRRDLFIDFTDDMGRDEVFSKTQLLFRQAERRANGVLAHQTVENSYTPAMAVHSEVRRFDSFDR